MSFIPQVQRGVGVGVAVGGRTSVWLNGGRYVGPCVGSCVGPGVGFSVGSCVGS